MNQPGPDKPKRPPVPPSIPPGRFGRSLLGWAVVIGLAVLLMTLFNQSIDERREISLTAFLTHARNGEIKDDIKIESDRILGELEEIEGAKEGEARKFFANFHPGAIETIVTDTHAAVAAGGKGNNVIQVRPAWWEGLLPNLLVLMLIFFVAWFFLFRRLGAAGGAGNFLGGFGRSKHRVMSKEHVKVTFDDVAGIEEAKEEVAEIIEFLRNPRKFQRLGGRVPRGVLLVGLPGCGKTLLAKAIAGQADVPFFSISGSDFVEMFVGVGASRVRDLFKQAKDSSPCIIFLDEIDAVGRKRGMGFSGGGHDEREQTLNAILVEMDGFDSSDQVIVIAATNRMDVLDPALTRPGRFDRQVSVPLPDLNGRREILKIYVDKVKCGPDMNLTNLARGTPMFSGADLEALVNEAAIAATMAEKDCVEQADFEEARDKVRWGRSRRSHVVDEKEKEITAYHEAGHAVVQLLLPDADPLHKVTILARGQMGGATFSLPEKDRNLFTRSYCHAMLSVSLGGRLAEEMFCNDISSGASSDIAQASQLARKMVLDWGMSDVLGFVRYSSDQGSGFPFDSKEYSEKTAEMIDNEIRRIIDAAYQDTRKLLEENRDRLEAVAHAILKYETLSADDVERIVAGETLDKPTVGDLLAREQGKESDSDSGPAQDAQSEPTEPPAPEAESAPDPS